MPVPVMNVRVVRVAVDLHMVDMEMCMRFGSVPGMIVGVPVMFVMHVAVGMCEGFVGVQVFVALGEMQPHARAHERCSRPEEWRRRFR